MTRRPRVVLKDPVSTPLARVGETVVYAASVASVDRCQPSPLRECHLEPCETP